MSSPAYPSQSVSSSPLHQYLQRACQSNSFERPSHNTTIPPRSGHAFAVPAGSIVRISTPVGPQVGDLNLWHLQNPREHFWASRTRQLHATHLNVFDRLWSCLPYMRAMATIVYDSIGARETSDAASDGEAGALRPGVHDLLGSRCDPYVRMMLSGETGVPQSYDYHCHSNLTRAIAQPPYHLRESDVHDVLNLFQRTSLDAQGRYVMHTSPAEAGDSICLFAEIDLLVALSTCPGGDLSCWNWEDEERMSACCRELKVEVLGVDPEILTRFQWKQSVPVPYLGMHGIIAA